MLGLLVARVASHLGLPRVAAYLMVGVVFSGDLLGDLLDFQLGPWSITFTQVALGVIAYLIGGSISINHLKRLGGTILGAMRDHRSDTGGLLCVLGLPVPARQY